MLTSAQPIFFALYLVPEAYLSLHTTYSIPEAFVYSYCIFILQNSAFQPLRGRLLYIKVVGCRRHVLLPLILPP